MGNILVVLSLIAGLAIPGIAHAEASDSFVSAPTIAINSYNAFSTTGSNPEFGEPWVTGYGSMWFRYVAPSRGIVRLNTTSIYYTYFQIFRGPRIDKLNLVEQGISKNSGTVTFPAETGMEFLIAVSTDYPSAEEVSFSILQDPWPYGADAVVAPAMPTSQSPPDDLFGSGNSIIPSSTSPVTVLAYNRSASSFYDGWDFTTPEPTTTGYHTLWYRWTAPSTGIANISTPASPVLSFEHVLSVFRGDGFRSLNVVKVGDDHIESSTSHGPVSLSFPVVKGLEYRICFGSRSKESGPVIFTIRTDAWPYGPGTVVAPQMPTANTPPNDQFEGATKLPSKPGEKFVIVDYSGSDTWDDPEGLWYQWTAQESAYVSFQTPAKPVLGYDHRLSSWSGSFSENLKLVDGSGTLGIYLGPPKTPGFARIGFFATKGRTYHLSFSTVGYNPWDPVIISYESGPQVNTTAPKVTFSTLGQTDLVFWKKFYVGLVVGTDPEGISAVQLKVNGKLAYNKPYSSRWFSVSAGPVKTGKVVLEARARDRFGRWGPYTKRVVMAQ